MQHMVGDSVFLVTSLFIRENTVEEKTKKLAQSGSTCFTLAHQHAKLTLSLSCPLPFVQEWVHTSEMQVKRWNSTAHCFLAHFELSGVLGPGIQYMVSAVTLHDIAIGWHIQTKNRLNNNFIFTLLTSKLHICSFLWNQIFSGCVMNGILHPKCPPSIYFWKHYWDLQKMPISEICLQNNPNGGPQSACQEPLDSCGHHERHQVEFGQIWATLSKNIFKLFQCLFYLSWPL